MSLPDLQTLAFLAVSAMFERKPLAVHGLQERPRNWPLPINKARPHEFRPMAVLEYVEERLHATDVAARMASTSTGEPE